MPGTDDRTQIRIVAKHILWCVDNGYLDPKDVLPAFQNIVGNRFGHPDLIGGMFTPPADQVKNLRFWNLQQEWGFTEDEILEVEDQLSNFAWPNDLLVVLVLVPYLETVERTIDELWALAAVGQTASRRAAALKSDSAHLRLNESLQHERGLRWEVIDLGSNWDRHAGISPQDVARSGGRHGMLAHVGLLALAAHSPVWVRSMDGELVPYVWLAGYDIRLDSSDKDWSSYTPRLWWHSATFSLQLELEISTVRGCRCSIPMILRHS